MKIVGPSNYYLEDVKGTFAEAEKLFQCFMHWPVEQKNLGACLTLCSQSAIRWNDTVALQNPLPDITKAFMFLKNPQDEVLGFFQFVFYQRLDEDGPNAFNVSRAVLLPEHRGQGKFTIMFDLIVYLGHYWMYAQEANVTTLSTAPQVQSKLEGISVSRVLSTKAIEGRWTEQENSMDYDDFHSRAVGRDAGFSFLINDVEVPPPYSSKNPRPE